MLDTVVKNVRVVRPNTSDVSVLDVGTEDGRFTRVEAQIPAGDAKELIDGQNQSCPTQRLE